MLASPGTWFSFAIANWGNLYYSKFRLIAFALVRVRTTVLQSASAVLIFVSNLSVKWVWMSYWLIVELSCFSCGVECFELGVLALFRSRSISVSAAVSTPQMTSFASDHEFWLFWFSRFVWGLCHWWWLCRDWGRLLMGLSTYELRRVANRDLNSGGFWFYDSFYLKFK